MTRLARAMAAGGRLARVRVTPVVMVALCGTILPVGPGDIGEPRAALAQAGKAEQGAGVEALPIKSITLYRSGVGYFERRGLVDGDRTVQLRFATDQINDILKSMVILIDPDGGRVASVGYGSKEPLDRRLASFGVNIGDNPTAGEILNRLRGSPVKLMTEEGEASGTIMNVEKRPTILTGPKEGGGGAQTVADLPWINLVTPKGVQSVNLTRVRGFEILDKDLAGELNKALSALAEHRADRIKSVDVAFANQGAKPVVVAYVHEMPVWKTSYRLVLPEAGEGGGGGGAAIKDAGTPTIQGWAMVENTTDEDWQDVRLSLVAGRPVSFQMDLYEPLHVARPEVPVPTVPGVMPRIYSGGENFERAKVLAEARFAPRKSGREGTSVTRGGAPGSPVPAPAAESGGVYQGQMDGDEFGLGQMSDYAAQAQAQAGEIGEVFQYQLKAPVSIARQRSAMLPILSASIEGKRVSIYNRADGSQHPMRGVHLTNTSGLQLMPGPISVFDGAAYAGDAQIGHVSVGDKRLLAYAVDLDVQALVKEDGTSSIRKIRIVNGLIEQTFKQEAKTSYAFANKDQKRTRTVLVEHAKMPGWALASPKKATEETEQVYRFEVELAAKESGTLDVMVERIDQQLVEMVSYDLPTMIGYAKDGKVSQKVVDAVKRAADMQAAINLTQQRIAQLDQERQAIDQDQARIRQNMGTVSRDTDLYRRYAGKLNDQETRLEAMREQREKEQQTLNTQTAERDAYVRGLNVE